MSNLAASGRPCGQPGPSQAFTKLAYNPSFVKGKCAPARTQRTPHQTVDLRLQRAGELGAGGGTALCLPCRLEVAGRTRAPPFTGDRSGTPTDMNSQCRWRSPSRSEPGRGISTRSATIVCKGGYYFMWAIEEDDRKLDFLGLGGGGIMVPCRPPAEAKGLL
jgi:hypothetical protein